MSDVWKFDEGADLPGDLPSAWDEITHLRLAYASLSYEAAELEQRVAAALEARLDRIAEMTDEARLAKEIRKHVSPETPGSTWWCHHTPDVDDDLPEALASDLIKAGWVWHRPIVNRQCPEWVDESTLSDGFETRLHCVYVVGHSGEHLWGSKTILLRKIEPEVNE